jgi:hypothetical protein
MGLEEKIKQPNAKKLNIACVEFKKFVSKYVANKPEYS